MITESLFRICGSTSKHNSASLNVTVWWVSQMTPGSHIRNLHPLQYDCWFLVGSDHTRIGHHLATVVCFQRCSSRLIKFPRCHIQQGQTQTCAGEEASADSGASSDTLFAKVLDMVEDCVPPNLILESRPNKSSSCQAWPQAWRPIRPAAIRQHNSRLDHDLACGHINAGQQIANFLNFLRHIIDDERIGFQLIGGVAALGKDLLIVYRPGLFARPGPLPPRLLPRQSLSRSLYYPLTPAGKAPRQNHTEWLALHRP